MVIFQQTKLKATACINGTKQAEQALVLVSMPKLSTTNGLAVNKDELATQFCKPEV